MDNKDDTFRQKFKEAIEKKDVKIIRRLLKGGVNPNNVFTMRHDVPILHEAVAKGNIDIIRALINANVKVNAENYEGRTPLHLAARMGDMNIVRELVQAGARVNAETTEYKTSLHVAAWREHADIVKYLVTSGGDVNRTDLDGTTLMHWAAKSRDSKLLEFLITSDGKVCTADNKGKTPLHEAASQMMFRNMFLLICHGADPCCKTKQGASVFTFLQRGYQQVSEENNDDLTNKVLRQEDDEQLAVVRHLVTLGADHNMALTYANQIRDPEKMHKLQTFINNSRADGFSLSLLCRTVIRRQIRWYTNGRDILYFIERLPLPSVLKEFLAFKNLMDYLKIK